MAVPSMSEPRTKMGLLVVIRCHLFSTQFVSLVRKVALPFAVSLIQRITPLKWCSNAFGHGEVRLKINVKLHSLGGATI